MKKLLLSHLIAFLGILPSSAFGQVSCSSASPVISNDFLMTIEENGKDIRAIDMKHLGNGDMLVLCSYKSSSGNADLMLVELDDAGNVNGKHVYSSATNEAPRKLLQNSSGNWVMVGETGNNTLLFVEVNSSWNIISSFTYSGSATERIRNAATCNGGFILTGNTTSWGAGSTDLLIIKLDDSGVTQWSQVIGGSGQDVNCHAVENPANGNICFAGNFKSGSSNDDVVVGELDSNGNLLWLRLATQSNNVAEGGHDVAVYGGHMYVVGIVQATDALLLDITLPTISTPTPSVTAHKYDTGDKESFSNITEIGGKLYLTGNIGNSIKDIFVLEVDPSGTISNQWIVGEGASKEVVGGKCEFNVDNQHYYFCGYTDGYNLNSNSKEKGLVVREDISDPEVCLEKAQFLKNSVIYSLNIPTDSSYDYCTTCRLSQTNFSMTVGTANLTIEDHCEDPVPPLTGKGFMAKLGINLKDVAGLDVVRLSDNEYVMLVAADELIGSTTKGDFMLVWFDQNGNKTKSYQYGTEVNDIPKNLFFKDDLFYVTGVTEYNDPNSPTLTDYNFFMMTIDNNTSSPMPHQVVDEGIYDISDGEERIRTASICANGDVIISGNTDNNGGDLDHVHIRVDASCGLIWTTQLIHPGLDNQSAATEDPATGNIWITGTFTSSTGSGDNNIILAKLDAGGVLNSSDFMEFNKSIFSPSPQSNEIGQDIMVVGTDILFGGVYNEGSGRRGMLGIHHPSTSGTPATTDFFQYGGISTETFQKFENVNGRLMLAGRFTNRVNSSSSDDLAVIEIDPTGSVIAGRYFGGNNLDKWQKSKIVQHSNTGEFYFCASSISFNNPVPSSGAVSEALLIKTSDSLVSYCNTSCDAPIKSLIAYLEKDSISSAPIPVGGGDHSAPQFIRADNSYDLTVICSEDVPQSATLRVKNTTELATTGQIKVYPNPAYDILILEFEGNYETGHIVHLYDASGQLVMKKQITGNTKQLSLDTQALKNGVYFIKHQSQHGLKVVKVLVQH